jgi:hypothetical protein
MIKLLSNLSPSFIVSSLFKFSKDALLSLGFDFHILDITGWTYVVGVYPK